ncbi:MAG TPA: valine--tRNA ligase [Caulobacteraceae bacterium]|jgi:valyl-tRNA synthetase|nr:valine--tRNA ligase [Caulobacteraceae bacterium]
MLDKTFDSAAIETGLYDRWEASGAFSPERALAKNPDAAPFSMVIPPPNVTGSLHIGHALNNTLQDVLIRFERMRGKAALWVVGTDHAGIATQMIVERQLAAAGNMGRRDLGRDAFVAKVWEWKAASGGTIVKQLRRLGASCDWSRERFTLDEGLSAAVRKVFVTLYKQKLIYRDKRLVNWDPQFQTAISDLEVDQREVEGHFWHFAYPLEDGSGEIIVATTRPETMLGDTAVAVHPSDERYKHLIGKCVRLPIVGRPIPIIADEQADPEKGSGAVKITPAHDFNDFRVGQRHKLPMINILDPFARLNDEVPPAYRGLDRFVARRKVVEEIEALGLLRGIETIRHSVPHGERSGVVVEPYLTDQWYVDAKVLAQPAIAAVEEGRTVLEPRNWEKTYFEWMRNIEPWCISRQLWWGHRIPAWFGPDGRIFVEETEEQARAAALEHYGRDEPLRQDEDVLDTWFSSGLWPFSTLGWPEETDDLKRFYPTDTLVTGFDIIFYWVARMMMLGIHFTGQVPFRRVVFNALVRDAEGVKMSKTKGNVLDPLELIDDYGCDAVRFTLTAMSGQARDIRLSRQRIEGYRNFGTKLWNAARFCEVNECRPVEGFDPAQVRHTLNRWMRGEAVKAAASVTAALDACAFSDAAGAIYRFIWNVFCDWYVELAKPILNGDDAAAAAETRATAAWTLQICLKLLHPISPFITETLWGEFGDPAEGMLITAPWPEPPDAWIDAEAEAELDWLIALIDAVRSIRAETNVPQQAKAPLVLVGAGPATRERLARHGTLIERLARLSGIALADAAPAGAVQFVIGEATGALAIAEVIDVAAERTRLAKEIAALVADADRTAKKLNNADFVARAPEEVVEENRERLAEAESARAKLEGALERLATLA